MKKDLFLITSLTLFFAGCTTARLPQGPDVFSLTKFPESEATVAVPKVVDARGTKNVGMIGAAGIQVRSDIAPFATNHLIRAVNSQMKLNVVRTEAITKNNAANILKSNNATNALVVSITSLKMHSIDAIMQPVEVDVTMGVTILNGQGQAVLEKTIAGHYEKRIGLSVVDKTTGELVDKVIQDAMFNLVKDEEIKKGLNLRV